MPFRTPHPAPRLLIADDEEGLRFLMTDLLRREGFMVHDVADGQESLEWLEREEADLLLLDLKLPDISASELVEKLRAKKIATPFIVITGHGDERTAAEIMRQGALDYVMKESGLLELLPSIVRRALATVERERKLHLAHQAVQHREERNRRIIQTALDGFIRFDSTWRLLEVNEALSELLGLAPAVLRRRKLTDLIVADSQSQAANWMEQLQQHGRLRCPTRLRRKNGREVEVEISLRTHEGEYFGFVHDVSMQRRLEREVLQATEEERRRFGRELHDGLGQQLTALELMSHTLARELQRKSRRLAESAAQIARYTREAVAQTRRMAHGLAPVGLESDGLRAALLNLAQVTKAAGVECTVECDSSVRLPDLGTATHLFRMAQEAVTNALKHAGAGHIHLRLMQADGAVVLSIQDDGIGMNNNHVPGLGLEVMQYRSHLIGAKLQIGKSDGHGVCITCSLPRKEA